MRTLFIRTPRHLWPYNSEASSFWQPLAFAYLAAALREAGHKDVEILDAPVLKMGWRSLEQELRTRNPQVVCIGEETVSAPEGLRLVGLVRALFGDEVHIIVGGHFFTYMEDYALLENDIDVVVRFEGEVTLVELLNELAQANPRLDQVAGIAYREGDTVRRTKPRALITDLDTLPMPAYDLLPMELYGKGAKNHPALGALEHSRGCPARCSYCILWRTMGSAEGPGIPKGEEVKPLWRTKSPDRTLEEVDLLVNKYGRKTLGWVDSTWNVDPAWSEEFCDGMIRRNYKDVQSTKWMRADYVLRDERLGVLGKQVAAGMVQVIIGFERPEKADFRKLDKSGYGEVVANEVADLFRSKYPSVFTIGSFIYGIPDETVESLNAVVDFAYELPVDYSFMLCMTPNPGTREWREAKEEGLIEVHDYRAYNFQTPIMRCHNMSRKELQRAFLRRNLRNLIRHTLKNRLFNAFPVFGIRRRETTRTALRKHATALLYNAAKAELLPSRTPEQERWRAYSVEPDWYKS